MFSSMRTRISRGRRRRRCSGSQPRMTVPWVRRRAVQMTSSETRFWHIAPQKIGWAVSLVLRCAQTRISRGRRRNRCSGCRTGSTRSRRPRTPSTRPSLAWYVRRRPIVLSVVIGITLPGRPFRDRIVTSASDPMTDTAREHLYRLHLGVRWSLWGRYRNECNEVFSHLLAVALRWCGPSVMTAEDAVLDCVLIYNSLLLPLVRVL